MKRITPIFVFSLIANFQVFSAIDFNREVRPLLASKCYACHGPDEEGRKAKLRLDVRKDALKNDVIVPGEVEDSEFHYRIHSDDPDEIMPPPESHSSLTQQEKELLDRWIKEGAKYDKHWAFVKPASPKVPAGKKGWVRNPIDAFISDNLTKNGLTPSEEADRYSLVRRLYLDLLAFPHRNKPMHLFSITVRMLTKDWSINYSDQSITERMGTRMADLARYADSNGYEKDRPRNIWPYRDWVIRALNKDMPYDQFTIEQLAGDMLPNATNDQKIATGFHRNTQLNEEGGIDPLEFRFYAAVDRVATTGTVWMGLTTGCAQCHTHKYDPITHDEYFGLMSLLDNVEEPDLFLYTDEQVKAKADLENQIAQKITELQKNDTEFEDAFAKWHKSESIKATPWKTLRPSAMKSNLPKLEVMDDDSIYSSGDVTKRDVFDLNFTSDQPITALRLEVLTDDRLPGQGPGRCYYEGRKGTFFLSEVDLKTSNGSKVQFAKPTATSGNGADKVIDDVGSSGWSSAIGQENHLILPLADPLPANTPFSIELLFERHFVASLGRFRISATSSTNQPRVSKIGVEAEHILSLKETAKSRDLSALRSIYLEKVYLERPAPTQPATVQTNTRWIWNAKGNRPQETLYFSKQFELKELPQSAEIFFTCDDNVEFFLNGNSIGSTDLWSKPVTSPIKKHFRKGVNFLTAKAANGGGPAGLIAQLSLKSKNGKVQHIFTDQSWKFVSQLPNPQAKEWHTQALPNPKSVVLVGKYGDGPWGNLGLPQGKPAKKPNPITQLRNRMPRPNHTLVMLERPKDNPRPTLLRHRGEYTSPKHEVPAGIPEIFGLSGDQEPVSRLEFARWVVSDKNPIGDRVVVNRAWRSLFGYGLIRTNGDFGTQAPAPDHPELLDWLATEFRKQGMSLKKLHRLIVTSSTYRQDSKASPSLLEKDPQNRLLARGPRFRLSGELIRDHMLKASGKLSGKMFGPGVYPPQPLTVLAHAFGNKSWNASKGEDRYRRSVYTFIKRTAPFAGFMTFDGTSGENCLAKRDRSNTPLQALTLLNDEMYLELARAAGLEVHRRNDDPVHSLFRRFLTRPPKQSETDVLQTYFDQQLQRLRKGEIKSSEIAADPKATPELAGKVLLARAIMNLDEAITKP
ncbi:MAG: hypothetical protein CM15mP130_2410 [Verrucomicrobiota bacterium]|nr:MAG: hypothetical protein CM15mP130_2410 [Verrucomicrobiota bacterium]